MKPLPRPKLKWEQAKMRDTYIPIFWCSAPDKISDGYLARIEFNLDYKDWTIMLLDGFVTECVPGTIDEVDRIKKVAKGMLNDTIIGLQMVTQVRIATEKAEVSANI